MNQTDGATWQAHRETAVGSSSRSARPNRGLRRFGADGWRASDSSPGCVIEYAEPELKCWMPMPSANLSRASAPSPWEGDDVQQRDGSGI
jgi:hypothetical protein